VNPSFLVLVLFVDVVAAAQQRSPVEKGNGI